MSRGLPGIRIEVAPPALTEVLPRMDVAVFVGFAATGPTHLPVAIESVAQYAAIFGPDAPLAWDGERSERVYANLGACVRAFFSNGGRRCWVVRVARTLALEAAWRGLPASAVTAAAVASANRFAMPGVLVLPSGGLPLAPAQAQARSLGAWSDPLRLSTALVASSFTLAGCSVLSAPRIGFATSAPLKPGDLIELGDSGEPSGGATRVFATIDKVTLSGGTAVATRQVEATICGAFETLTGQIASPPASVSGNVEIAGITAVAMAATLQASPLSAAGVSLRFAAALPAGLAVGHWARWSAYNFSTVDFPGATSTFLSCINNKGQIVGLQRDSNGVRHSILTDGRSCSTFDPPGSTNASFPGISSADGINDNGEIVGYVKTSDGSGGQAYIKNADTFSFYNHPSAGTGPGRVTEFDAINNAGVRVGAFQDNTDTPHGFIQVGETTTRLEDDPNVPANKGTFILGINNHNQIVGVYFDAVRDIQHGFFKDGNIFITIDFPGSTITELQGINDRGQMAGSYFDEATGTFHGFLTDGRTFMALDYPNVSGQKPGTVLTGINNSGHIVGYYGDDLERLGRAGIHGFLATPIEAAWIRVDAIDRRVDPIDRTTGAINGMAWREAPLILPDPAPTRASVLTLDVRVTAAPDNVLRLRGVGLTPAHDASWWNQVSDDVAYAPRSGFAPATPPASDPGFPLAAPDTERGDAAPRALIPLGASTLYGAPLGPLPQAATALERDGLARFDAELFLDPALASLRVDTLIEQADVVRFLGSAPRALFGIHAALSIGEGGLYNEATLLAIPDALNTGWKKRDHADPPPATLAGQPPPAQWFAHRGPCAAAPKDAVATQPDFSSFLDCGTRALATPHLSGPPDTVPRGAFSLTWSSAELGATYVLQEARRSDFGDAREVYRGGRLSTDIEATREGIFYYSISALAGDERSAASNVVPVVVRDDDWMQAGPAIFAASGERELVRIHRAALRLAAASAELFVVLGLPRHYRAPDAINYAARLRARPAGSAAVDSDAFAFNERRALSYGALYHPWALFGPSPAVTTDQSGQVLTLPSTAASQRVCPPDGIATGVLAARATARGAWIAPANEPFKDVVALAPQIGAETWPALQDAQINLIRADARGFLTLAADTLSDEDEFAWRPINVRRLLVLLRRLALRRGVSYVFEPNGDTLRRSVQRGFTLLLTDLFRQGAFAGDTAAESFKVVTDETINTDADRDVGRFLVELRVAPSLPLQFLTVRLVQSGERLTVAEGL